VRRCVARPAPILAAKSVVARHLMAFACRRYGYRVTYPAASSYRSTITTAASRTDASPAQSSPVKSAPFNPPAVISAVAHWLPPSALPAAIFLWSRNGSSCGRLTCPCQTGTVMPRPEAPEWNAARLRASSRLRRREPMRLSESLDSRPPGFVHLPG
jgi:hypothetical protein